MFHHVQVDITNPGKLYFQPHIRKITAVVGRYIIMMQQCNEYASSIMLYSVYTSHALIFWNIHCLRTNIRRKCLSWYDFPIDSKSFSCLLFVDTLRINAGLLEKYQPDNEFLLNKLCYLTRFRKVFRKQIFLPTI